MSYKSKSEEVLEIAFSTLIFSISFLCLVLSVLAIISFFERH